MTLSRQEWIDRAIAISGKQGVEMPAESLLQSTAQAVAIDLCKQRDTRSLLRSLVVVSFASGTGTLPAGTLTQFMQETNLFDGTNATSMQKRYSFEPQWENFVRFNEHRLGAYHNDGLTIYLIEPNATYSPTTGFTGNRNMSLLITPSIPNTAGGIFSTSDEVINRLVVKLAMNLEGARVSA